MRNRLVMLGALLLALTATLAWYGINDALEQRGKVTALELSLKNERARTARVQALVGKVEAKREQAQTGLDAALAREREWASSPAPVPVSDELCKRLRCK